MWVSISDNRRSIVGLWRQLMQENHTNHHPLSCVHTLLTGTASQQKGLGWLSCAGLPTAAHLSPNILDRYAGLPLGMCSSKEHALTSQFSPISFSSMASGRWQEAGSFPVWRGFGLQHAWIGIHTPMFTLWWSEKKIGDKTHCPELLSGLNGFKTGKASSLA
jgi:hypothetical protein